MHIDSLSSQQQVYRSYRAPLSLCIISWTCYARPSGIIKERKQYYTIGCQLKMLCTTLVRFIDCFYTMLSHHWYSCHIEEQCLGLYPDLHKCSNTSTTELSSSIAGRGWMASTALSVCIAIKPQWERQGKCSKGQFTVDRQTHIYMDGWRPYPVLCTLIRTKTLQIKLSKLSSHITTNFNSFHGSAIIVL